MLDFRQINTVRLTLNCAQSIETNSDTYTTNLPFLIYSTRFFFLSLSSSPVSRSLLRLHRLPFFFFVRVVLFFERLTNSEGGNFILTHVKLMSYMTFQLTLCLMKWNSVCVCLFVVTHTSCAWTQRRCAIHNNVNHNVALSISIFVHRLLARV